MKEHIQRLPTVDYSEILGKTKQKASPISLSIPLFHSSFQFIRDAKKAKYFKDVHCRGAVWTAISFLKNTDLGDNDISIFFHVEDKVYKRAKSVFDEFNVPDYYVRKMSFNKDDFPPTPTVKNVRYGKKFLCLYDTGLKNVKNWVIIDSDCFPISTDGVMPIYNVLNSHCVTNHPASIEYKLIGFERKHWLNRISDAAGLKYTEAITENGVLKYMGLDPIAEDTREWIHRPRCKTTLMSIPKSHPIVPFIKKNVGQCCEDEFLLACYSMYAPFVDLSTLINAPVVTTMGEYAQCYQDQYFHHLIFDSVSADSYYTRFFRDITRNVEIPNQTVSEFEDTLPI